jgi:hypothetical protein
VALEAQSRIPALQLIPPLEQQCVASSRILCLSSTLALALRGCQLAVFHLFRQRRWRNLAETIHRGLCCQDSTIGLSGTRLRIKLRHMKRPIPQPDSRIEYATREERRIHRGAQGLQCRTNKVNSPRSTTPRRPTVNATLRSRVCFSR